MAVQHPARPPPGGGASAETTEEEEEDVSAHLGSHKVSGVARGHQQPVVGAQLLGEAKVTDSDGLWVS